MLYLYKLLIDKRSLKKNSKFYCKKKKRKRKVKMGVKFYIIQIIRFQTINRRHKFQRNKKKSINIATRLNSTF